MIKVSNTVHHDLQATKVDIMAVANLDDALPTLDQVSQLSCQSRPFGMKSMSSGMAGLSVTTSAACGPTAALVGTAAPTVETAAADPGATQQQVQMPNSSRAESSSGT